VEIIALDRAPHQAELAYKLSLIEMHRREFHRESGLAGAETSEAIYRYLQRFFLARVNGPAKTSLA